MPKMIQIRHVPDHVHRRLKARAALEGMPLSDYLLKEIKLFAEAPTVRELEERLARRKPVKIDVSPAEVIRAERDNR